MMAGQLLYAETATSALAEDTRDASVVIDPIRVIEDEEELVIRPDTQIFGTMGPDTVRDSPMGSPTVRSRPLTTAEQWLQARDLTTADVKSKGS